VKPEEKKKEFNAGKVNAINGYQHVRELMTRDAIA